LSNRRIDKAVFLDRDGVINHVPSGHLLHERDILIYPNVRESIELLGYNGYAIAIITNQSCISNGIISAEEVEKLNLKIIKLIDKFNYVKISAICPHDNKDNCLCRKPKPGLINSILSMVDIDLSKSWLIGDSLSDVCCGLNIGIKSILVRTGRGNEQEKRINSIDKKEFLLCCDDLFSASKEILRIGNSFFHE
jgi:D-glycero-D-manno-heptose 1,7-bisphosphate phosphatase